ncbi:GNAT family N-acetyltransferase [Weissella ceti]|uniref:GNAT family N-acetyltransferase n=1 Tax=Weissella ceti TaxID=759620 RepID=A0ABT3E589_9LACO|nr:GNAT family N-acetyltransferase [Weissella ceti]MCW0953394.1 GNAT family N-acetyltransferase [Weissella ceti]QVK11998.1 GNAT family N-acetyltransferase [Weissella ceti]
MRIQAYEDKYLTETMTMIKECILAVNQPDYSPQQVKVWAELDPRRFQMRDDNHAFVMLSEEDAIIGFSDMDDAGYLDNMFVHKDYQGQGIATRLLKHIENSYAMDKITTYASITAKPFFERHGYQVVRENQAELRGEVFVNYYMEKLG